MPSVLRPTLISSPAAPPNQYDQRYMQELASAVRRLIQTSQNYPVLTASQIALVNTSTSPDGLPIGTVYLKTLSSGETALDIVSSADPSTETAIAVIGGNGAPASSLGLIGELYIDAQNKNLYGPKTLAGWGSAMPLGGGGSSATIAVGSTTTGAPGTSASVNNSGTSSAAVFNFTIPRGADGATGAAGSPGAPGAAATVAVGTTTTGSAGSPASVTNSGSSSAAVLNFTVPQGPAGPAPSGAANLVLATPDGASGTSSLRSLVVSDIPTLNQNTTGMASNITGTLAIANGGTSSTSAASALIALGGASVAGSNSFASTQTFNGALFNLDSGAIAQMRLLSGTSPGVILRNDGTSFYLLFTNNGNPNGSWNALRPITIALSSGTMTLDQTGAGVNFASPAAISFGSNFQSWTPSFAGSGGMSILSSSVSDASYLRIGPFVKVHLKCNVSFTGTGANSFSATLPVAQFSGGDWESVTANTTGPGVAWQPIFAIAQNGNLLMFFNNAAAWPTGSTFTVDISGVYRCA